MNQSSISNPLLILQDIEAACKEQARDTAIQQRPKDQWTGLGFKLGEAQFLFDAKSIVEIFSPQGRHKPAAVPGAKAWLKGLISHRGQLLSIIDLRQFLLQEPVTPGKHNRVIVVRIAGHPIGLLVDEVQGLKYFRATEKAGQQVKYDAAMTHYLGQIYQRDNEHWAELDLNRLAANANFANAASS